MPEFATPEPISATVEISVGEVQVVAGDRTETSVQVRPSDPDEPSDVKAAEQTRVDYADGRLVVKGPRSRTLDFSRKSRSVDVLVELPAGSGFSCEAAVVNVRSSGELAECRVRTATGSIDLDRVGTLRVTTSAGDVAVQRVTGAAEISTGSGRVRVGELAGAATVKNSNGNTEIGTAGGDLRAESANGDITVTRAERSVQAKTANGGVRLGQVRRGTVSLRTGMGNLEVGIAEGTAALLDVHTGFGKVRNEMESAPDGPGDAVDTVEVHANTAFGDVAVHRA